MAQLTKKMVARNYIEKVVICPELDRATREDMASFEEEFTPQNKYAGYGKYDFRTKADEDRACHYGHAHFLLNRYLTALVRHLKESGIAMGKNTDFIEHIWPQVDEKLEAILTHELARPQSAPALDMTDFANTILSATAKTNTAISRQLTNPEPQEAA